MQRVLLGELVDWARQESYIPILLRGARQVGKTYLIEYLGKHYFDNLVTINFEFQKQYIDCFDSLDPQQIINRIELMSGEEIIPRKTLLFFDEIQSCPNAIVSLRYFKEKLPQLHVIAAESLLEFALQEEGLSMPVGRVSYLYLKPLSFQEFLTASSNQKLLEFIKEINLNTHIPEVIHKKLLALAREYMVIGGMPGVVAEYLQSQRLKQTQNLQTAILRTYQDDFAKYATKTKHKYLQLIYEKAPGLVGTQIKYTGFSETIHSRELKSAITDLEHAGVLKRIYLTSASGLPLNTYINEKKFKIIFLDVGLLKRAVGLDIELLMTDNLLLLNHGAVAEQFVGQELLAYQDPYDKPQLYYWAREEKSAKAEVDYVINVGGTIVPIEVKAGKTGSLKSLHLMLEEKKISLGVRVSEKPLSMNGRILSIPFYLVGEIARLVRNGSFPV